MTIVEDTVTTERLLETFDAEFLAELEERTVVIITDGASQGPYLTLGTIQQVTIPNGWVSIRYVPERHGAGYPTHLDAVEWKNTYDYFSCSILHPSVSIEDDGTVVFHKVDDRRATARILTAEDAQRVRSSRNFTPVA